MACNVKALLTQQNDPAALAQGRCGIWMSGKGQYLRRPSEEPLLTQTAGCSAPGVKLGQYLLLAGRWERFGESRACPERAALPKESSKVALVLWSRGPSLQGAVALRKSGLLKSRMGTLPVPLQPAVQRKTRRAEGFFSAASFIRNEMYRAERQCIWYSLPHPRNGCPSHNPEKSQDKR